MITVHRRYRFSAAHRLHAASLGEAQNQELFGKCNNPFGHGHNYELEVSAEGEIDPLTGRAVDVTILDELVAREVIARYDHRYLNGELPEFARVVPTTENLGLAVEQRLSGAWASAFPAGEVRLRRIRIFETARNIIQIGDQE